MGKHRESTIHHPAVYAKAIVAAVVAFTGTAATAAADGAITYGEWWGIAAATAVALATVYGIPNRDPRVEAQDQSVQPPDVEGIHKPTKPAQEDGDGIAGGYYGGH